MSSFLFWIKKRMSPQGNLKDNMGIIFVYTRGLFCCGMVVSVNADLYLKFLKFFAFKSIKIENNKKLHDYC